MSEHYQMYRQCTLGTTLIDSLDLLIQRDQMNPEIAHKVLSNFDRAMSEALARVKTKYSCKGKLETYRYCDDVWTFMLKEVTVKSEGEELKADSLKIVACTTKKEDKD